MNTFYNMCNREHCLFTLHSLSSSAFLLFTNPPSTHHSLVDLLLQTPDSPPAVLQESSLFREEGRRAATWLPHQPTEVAPLDPRQSVGLGERERGHMTALEEIINDSDVHAGLRHLVQYM